MDKFEFKGTQGKWKIAGDLDDLVIVTKANKVASVVGYENLLPNYETSKADAQLIVHAPDTAFKLFKVNDLIKKYTSGKMDEEEFKNLLLGVTKANDIHLEKILK